MLRRTGSVFAFGSRIAGARSFFAVKCTVVGRGRAFSWRALIAWGASVAPSGLRRGDSSLSTDIEQDWPVCGALRDTAWILIYSYFKRNSAFSETVYLTENFVTTPCPNVEAEAVRQPIEDVLKRVSLKLDSFFTNQKKCFLSERAVTVQIFFCQVKRLHGKFSCQSLCWIFCCWSSKNFAGLLSRKGLAIAVFLRVFVLLWAWAKANIYCTNKCLEFFETVSKTISSACHHPVK